MAAGCGDPGVVYAEGGEGDEWVIKFIGENRCKDRVTLTVLDEADEGAIESGEFGKFFLRDLFYFALFLEDSAKDLFFVRCHWMNR